MPGYFILSSYSYFPKLIQVGCLKLRLLLLLLWMLAFFLILSDGKLILYCFFCTPYEDLILSMMTDEFIIERGMFLERVFTVLVGFLFEEDFWEELRKWVKKLGTVLLALEFSYFSYSIFLISRFCTHRIINSILYFTCLTCLNQNYSLQTKFLNTQCKKKS